MLFTVGHSTLDLKDFLDLLQEAQIAQVVDVRTLPGSNKFPHFNEEALAESLPAAGIAYSREVSLGGLRGKTEGVDPQTNGFWQNASFHRYADYAMGEKFKVGLKKVLKEVETHNVAVMCAEAVWWRCHRRIIADYALAWDNQVKHLMPGGRISEASLTDGARVGANGVVTYPKE